MSSTHYLFDGTITNGAFVYVGVPISPLGTIGVQISWLDTTTSAAIVLELTNYDADEAPVASAGSAWKWKDSGVSITGPTGGSTGSSIVNIENVRQRRARLKITATAASRIQVTEGMP